MPKMTKAQARKRLTEATSKMMAVNAAYFEGNLRPPINARADMKKLFNMALELRKIIDKFQ